MTDPQQNPFPVFFPGFPATVEAQQQAAEAARAALNEPADPDDVLHHITVADVERLHGMVLTRGEAEQVADRLATGLAGALNQLRRLS